MPTTAMLAGLSRVDNEMAWPMDGIKRLLQWSPFLVALRTFDANRLTVKSRMTQRHLLPVKKFISLKNCFLYLHDSPQDKL
jgi:hypothetical protein